MALNAAQRRSSRFWLMDICPPRSLLPQPHPHSLLACVLKAQVSQRFPICGLSVSQAILLRTKEKKP